MSFVFVIEIETEWLRLFFLVILWMLLFVVLMVYVYSYFLKVHLDQIHCHLFLMMTMNCFHPIHHLLLFLNFLNFFFSKIFSVILIFSGLNELIFLFLVVVH